MNVRRMNIQLSTSSFDVNRGTAEAQWGGVGEAGEQGQLLFFWGIHPFLLKFMTRQILYYIVYLGGRSW